MSSRKLTGKQLAYMNNRIAGMGVSESYRAAYDVKVMSDKAISVAANRLEKDARIALELNKSRKKAASKALVTAEDIAKMLLAEAQNLDDGSTQGARVSALKVLTDYTGGFDNNRQKVDQRNVEMTHEQWLESLDGE